MTDDSALTTEAAAQSDCVVVTDGEGDVLWTSPSTKAVFRPDGDLATTGALGTLLDLGVDVPAAGATEEELHVRPSEGPAFDLAVVARAVDSDGAVTVYHCRRAAETTADDAASLAALQTEVDRLTRMVELLRDVNGAIVTATDRADIERAVCDILTDMSAYRVALTVRMSPEETFTVEQVAGLSPERLSDFRSRDDGHIEGTIEEVARTGEPAVLTDIHSDERHPDGVQAALAEHGIVAIACIPMVYDGVVYGVLCVAATEAAAVVDRELAVLTELGQTLGTAIDAIQTKHLLYATAFRELELSVDGPEAPLIEANAALGGTWELERVVPVEAGRYLLYVDVDGVEADQLASLPDEIAAIETVRLVERGPTHLAEFRVRGPDTISALLDAGGWVRGATVADGSARVVVEVTLDTDIRAYLECVERAGVTVDLLAKREVEHSPPEGWAGRDHIASLTDRQQAVLEAAYVSGYFDWPRRRTTGEELADSLDIASSTVHQHLRIATAKVLERYFSGMTVEACD